MQSTKRLTKSNDRKIAGVCGGLAEYFDVDPSLVRLLFVVFALAGGPGLLVYLVMAIVMPNY
jgi:phage shock protein PspC (stress-responsive transcriptional regulator)